MRYTEFKSILTESTITLNDFENRNAHYWTNFLDLVSNNRPIKIGTTGSTEVLFATPKKQVTMLKSIWDGTQLATPEQVAQLKKVVLYTTDGDQVKLNNIFKGPEIKGAGASDEKSKFWNLGNVIEGIMGAAVTAKFKLSKRDITSDDITKVLQSMKAGTPIAPKKKSKAQPLVPYNFNTKVGVDRLTFTLSLNANDMGALQMSFNNPDELQLYPNSEEIFKAYVNAANYVNTAATVKTAIDRVISDPGSNSVIIESEGGSAEKQTSTKADLFITIDGVRERLLSLKSKTVPQIGQVSGHAFANLEEFFKSTVGFGLPSNFAKSFPAGTFKEVGRGIYERAFPKAYKHIFSSIKQELSGAGNYPEYNFIEQIFKAIIHHATLGEEVIVVYLGPSAKKAYIELKFGPELLTALNDFDLTPVMAGATIIKILGKPVTDLGNKVSGGKNLELIQLRSYISAGNTIRNIVEVGPLLKALTDIEKINTRTNQAPPVQAAPSKPAKAAPTPAAQKSIANKRVTAPVPAVASEPKIGDQMGAEPTVG